MIKFFWWNKSRKLSHRKIHAHLRKHSPEGVKKAKRLFGFKYPKLFLLLFSVIGAYFLFRHINLENIMQDLRILSYPGFLVIGALNSFSFSAPFALGLLIKSNINNIILASLIFGFGAMIGDMIIFKTIKTSFIKEFKELEKTKIVHGIEKIVKKNKHVLIRHYLLYLFAGIAITSPLPDELGVSMLAGLTTINPIKLAVISFSLKTLSAFFILRFI